MTGERLPSRRTLLACFTAATGHGDTATDSHLGWRKVTAIGRGWTRNCRLSARRLCGSGFGDGRARDGPALDSKPDTVATVSPPDQITDLFGCDFLKLIFVREPRHGPLTRSMPPTLAVKRWTHSAAVTCSDPARSRRRRSRDGGLVVGDSEASPMESVLKIKSKLRWDCTRPGWWIGGAPDHGRAAGECRRAADGGRRHHAGAAERPSYR